MDVGKQRKNSEGHKDKSRAIAFSCFLDKLGVNAEDGDDVNVITS